MSLVCQFFHETFDGTAWVAEPSAGLFGFDPFLWHKTKHWESRTLHGLFLAPDALIPFHKGPPPDPRPSKLCDSLMRLAGRFEWVPFEDIFLDDWDAEEILISKWVPIPQAGVFGDGRAPFPDEALQALGLRPNEIREIRCGSVVQRSVSHLWGEGLKDLRKPVTAELVEVTWMDSIAGYLGEKSVSAFRSLRDHGRPSRIIVNTA
jgi:hypothetical protein